MALISKEEQKKIEHIFKKIFLNMTLIFCGWILFMDVVAVLAPVLAYLGFDQIAHVIYFIYSFLCHQRPWRSLHLFDYQVAWCTRDTFTYLAMAVSAFLVVKSKIRSVRWYIPLLATLPFALDGTIQLIAEIRGVVNNEMTFFYSSTNLVRMLTGSIFGAGAGIWLFSMLEESIHEEFGENKPVKKKGEVVRHFKYILFITAVCFILYVLFIQIWNITSVKYKPYGLFDNKRYYPGVNYEDIGGGGHGI